MLFMLSSAVIVIALGAPIIIIMYIIAGIIDSVNANKLKNKYK